MEYTHSEVAIMLERLRNGVTPGTDKHTQLNRSNNRIGRTICTASKVVDYDTDHSLLAVNLGFDRQGRLSR